MKSIPQKDRDNLIKLLREGMEIPENYKDVLFDNKEVQKEYELVYAGKAREEDIIADCATSARSGHKGLVFSL